MRTPLSSVCLLLLALVLGACSATRQVSVQDKSQDLDGTTLKDAIQLALNNDGYRGFREQNISDKNGTVIAERNGGFAHWFGIQGTVRYAREEERWRVDLTCESPFGLSTLESEAGDAQRQLENTLNGLAEKRKTARETTAKNTEVVTRAREESKALKIPPPTGRAFALVVAVGSNSGVGKVDKAASDAEMMKKLLEGPRWGLKSDDIKLLVNQQATRAAILESLKELEAKSQDGDDIVLYFGGNWRAQKGDDFDCYLPYDWKKSSNKAEMKAMGITPEDLRAEIDKAKGRRHVVFLNCNFVGSDDEDYYTDKGLLQTEPKLGSKLEFGLNVVVTPAAPVKQTPWPRATGEQSPMVAALKEIVEKPEQTPINPPALKDLLEVSMKKYVIQADQPKVSPQVFTGGNTELAAMPVVPLARAGR